jgi:hypothetical protein
VLLGSDFDRLPRFKLGEADGGLAGNPLVFPLANQRLAQCLADDLAGIVVETGRNLRLHGFFQFRCQGYVHGCDYKDWQSLSIRDLSEGIVRGDRLGKLAKSEPNGSFNRLIRAYQDLLSGKSDAFELLNQVQALEKPGVTEGTLAEL